MLLAFTIQSFVTEVPLTHSFKNIFTAAPFNFDKEPIKTLVSERQINVLKANVRVLVLAMPAHSQKKMGKF
jgi:hypothetical protein